MIRRGTYVLRKNAKGEYILVPKHLAAPLKASGAPSIIRDDLGQGLKHMGNGRVTDSKSQFRRWTKESGCIEVGNDYPTKVPEPKINLPNVRADLAQNWERLGLK